MKPVDLRDFQPPGAKAIIEAAAKATRDAQPPLRVTVEWGTRLANGALLMLLAAVAVGIDSIVWSLAPAARPALSLTIGPLTAVLGAIGVWLISTPDPQDATWLGKRRWLVRASVVLSLTQEVVTLACMALLWLSMIGEWSAASAHGVVFLINTTASIAVVWYLAAVADGLKDRFLRCVYSFCTWAGAAIMLAFIGTAPFAWAKSCERWIYSVRPSTPPSQPGPSPWVLAVFLVALSALVFYVNFRLWRRLRRALRAAREEAQLPPSEAVGPAGESSDE